MLVFFCFLVVILVGGILSPPALVNKIIQWLTDIVWHNGEASGNRSHSAQITSNFLSDGASVLDKTHRIMTG